MSRSASLRKVVAANAESLGDVPLSSLVLASFNTWAIKREKPSDAAMLEAFIDAAVQEQRPVPFVLYWGKGPRSRAASPDAVCLDFIGGLGERIGQVYAPGAEVMLICTDTHARLNGHGEDVINAYFADIAALGAARGFRACRLSDLVARAEPFGEPVAACNEAHLQLLLRSASRWFRGGGSSREGAEAYLQQNMVERRAVEIAFPKAIFATFNGSEFDFLFPERLPRFYMYALRKGCAIKPWFMDADGRPYSAAP